MDWTNGLDRQIIQTGMDKMAKRRKWDRNFSNTGMHILLKLSAYIVMQRT